MRELATVGLFVGVVLIGVAFLIGFTNFDVQGRTDRLDVYECGSVILPEDHDELPSGTSSTAEQLSVDCSDEGQRFVRGMLFVGGVGIVIGIVAGWVFLRSSAGSRDDAEFNIEERPGSRSQGSALQVSDGASNWDLTPEQEERYARGFKIGVVGIVLMVAVLAGLMALVLLMQNIIW